MSEAAALLTAIAGLVSAIFWPAVVVVAIFAFRQPLSALLKSDDLSVTAPGGISVTAKRKATNALVEASKKDQGSAGVTKEQAEAEINESQRQMETVENPLILWVDDKPSHNRYERQAMEALGMNFVTATATSEAVEKAAQTTFDLMISDMSRPPDEEAGYTLLHQLQASGSTIPFVIYTWNADPAAYDRAVKEGAVGLTNLADELVRIVVGALRTRQIERGR